MYVRELYAITESVAKFRQYLLGHHFIIRTDHASLRHLQDQVLQTLEQESYLYRLLGYNFEIAYRSGKQNQAADALSRVQCMALSFIEGTFMDHLYTQVCASSTIQRPKHISLPDQTWGCLLEGSPGYSPRRRTLNQAHFIGVSFVGWRPCRVSSHFS